MSYRSRPSYFHRTVVYDKPAYFTLKQDHFLLKYVRFDTKVGSFLNPDTLSLVEPGEAVDHQVVDGTVGVTAMLAWSESMTKR